MAKRMLVAVALSVVATAHLMAQTPTKLDSSIDLPPSGPPIELPAKPADSVVMPPVPAGPPAKAKDTIVVPSVPVGPVSDTSAAPQLSQTTDPDSYWLNPSRTSRFWFQGEYLLWFVRGTSAPPLITAGSATDPIPGALGQPNTQVLYGGGNITFGGSSGVRLTAGLWLDDERNWGINSSAFYLGTRSTGASYGSDGSGNPTFGQPVVIPGSGEQAYSASYPGYIAGNINASLSSQFVGWDLNLSRNLYRGDSSDFSAYLGFRYFSLHEGLQIDSSIQQLQTGVLSYLGQPINVGDQLMTQDRFVGHTNFYGGQIGGKYSFNFGRLGVDAIGKLAMGVSEESYNISGWTTLVPVVGQTVTTQGGILAQSTNIGHYSQSKFAVAPELILNVHYDLTPWARVGAGYSMVYLTSVARPGLVVDRTVDPGRVPSDQAYGQATTANSPGFQFHDTFFWAQGVSFSVQIRY